MTVVRLTVTFFLLFPFKEEEEEEEKRLLSRGFIWGMICG